MTIATLYQHYSKNFLVDTDTRNIRKNSIFFALKGERFNANTFAEKAIELGAKFAVIDNKAYQKNDDYILVDDVLTCLQQLANYHRKQLHIPILGLTGSNGKTTTKELVDAVLRQKFKTVATKGNLNNHIGVPLTLLSMDTTTEFGIVEMGANHQKEIEFLSAICEPDFGYITNFGKAHLEGFGGIEGVIKGKSELYSYLKNNKKTAFVNHEDAIQMKKTASLNRVLFLDTLQFLAANPYVKISLDKVEIQSNLIGKYNYSNIAAAITIGHYFNVTNEKIKIALENYLPNNNRSQVITTPNNTIILDAYNANPSSMKLALESFADLDATLKTIILGDMFELGESSWEEHQAIVDFATSLQCNRIYLVGEHFYKTKTNAPKFKSYEAFLKTLEKNPIKNSHIFIKGSRGMRLERILKVLLN